MGLLQVMTMGAGQPFVAFASCLLKHDHPEYAKRAPSPKVPPRPAPRALSFPFG